MPFIAGSVSVRSSLSGFAEGAGRSIAVLTEFAKQQVPRKEWGNTKVQLMVARDIVAYSKNLGGWTLFILYSASLIIRFNQMAMIQPYTVALLHDGIGITMNDKRVGFANNNGSIPFDCTIGACILSMVELELEPLEPANMEQMVGNASVTYFSSFAILLIGLLAAFSVLQLRKPQLKTI
ncbi:apyrase 6 isoform X2 [Tripterygium wilfordii]|uniref:Apyrase 6 isoform X2 n=1 Tax=Tripterygium wilfordii TaxID=458696 RepID=A0A7J7C126_TRIWF|nr:apyrase 6 isoform X2 [Tripterygium wilfordii]